MADEWDDDCVSQNIFFSSSSENHLQFKTIYFFDHKAPSKPVAGPSRSSGAIKKANNDDEWDDEPQPSTSNFRGKTEN